METARSSLLVLAGLIACGGEGGSTGSGVVSDVALLDAQPGHGVLLEAHTPVRHIILVDYDAFVRALGLASP